MSRKLRKMQRNASAAPKSLGLKRRAAAPVPSEPAQITPTPPIRPSQTVSSVPGLSILQDRFVANYLITGSATKAAIAAGYSTKGAAVQGAVLLRKPIIAQEIRRRQDTLAQKFGITADRVLAELALIGFSNMQNYMRTGPDGEPVLDLSNISREEAAALQEVTVEEFKDGRSDKREVRRVKFKLADKRAALELLGNNLGLFSEKHEHKHDHRHQHTLMGTLLREIDDESRAPKMIEHQGADR